MIAGTSTGERVFHVINYIFLTLLGLCFGVPFYLIVIASFTDGDAFLANGYSLFPKKLSVDAYKKLFAGGQIWRSFKSSLIITIGGTLASVLGTSLVAYSVSKRDLVGRSIIMNIIVFAMLFGGGMIPGYVLMIRLGLKNTYWAFILPGILSIWNMILIRSYFYTISPAIEEAAKIDGCRHFRIYSTIFMPLSLPILATVTLFTAIGAWNNWMGPRLYIDTKHYNSMMPLSAWLKDMLEGSQNEIGKEPVFNSKVGEMATIVVTITPIMLVYPMLQKYFVKGIMVGSVKG